MFLAFRGRRTEALAEIAKIEQLDAGLSAAEAESYTYYVLRDYPRLIEASRRGLLCTQTTRRNTTISAPVTRGRGSLGSDCGVPEGHGNGE